MSEAVCKMKVIPLGAGCEVGRSCILVEYDNTKIFLDCGLHPAYQGILSLPYFDQIDLSTIDLCLITHFHLDHCGSVPHLLTQTSFNGKVIMTDPTKAISQLIWNDYYTFTKNNKKFASEEIDIESFMNKIITINFNQKYIHKDVEVTAFPAGHVVGACMFHLRYKDETTVLYTGDYSNENERHTPALDFPSSMNIHVLIAESTHGVRSHEPRLAREKRFVTCVEQIVYHRNGKCLLPIFALGRVQELLLILEEHWAANSHLQHIPIIYISALSSKGIDIMTEYSVSYGGTYVCNKALRGQNAFDFKYVTYLKSYEDFIASTYANTPCVVFAAPGMLQNGCSRQLFELWCHDKANGVILTGYTLKGTLGDQLKNSPNTIQKMEGKEIPVRSTLDIIFFSAHADFEQTKKLLDTVCPPIVILVHGEKSEMKSLYTKLKSIRPSLNVFTPKILQAVEITIDNKNDLILGEISDKIELLDSSNNYINSIILNHKNNDRKLVSNNDLKYLSDVDAYALNVEWSFTIQQDFCNKLTLDKLYNQIRMQYDNLWPTILENKISVYNVYLYISNPNKLYLNFNWTQYKGTIADKLAYLILSNYCTYLSMNLSETEYNLLLLGLEASI